VNFNRDDRVRLIKEEDGVPAGSEGLVMESPDRPDDHGVEPAIHWVAFFTHGAHQVPEESLEAVDEPA
jgi:hypothetical protein